MHRKVDTKTLNKLFSDSWPTDYQGGDQKVGRSATKHNIANAKSRAGTHAGGKGGGVKRKFPIKKMVSNGSEWILPCSGIRTSRTDFELTTFTWAGQNEWINDNTI